MAHPIAFLDVFAERPLAGNGLAVVGDAGGVRDEVMQAFAFETRLSETTFVQPAGDDGADYRNRIWTPTEELPFAGHPSLGTAVAVTRWRGEDEASLVQQTAAGLQPIGVRREETEGPERWWATMLQAETVFGAELDRGEVMAAVGLEAADADPELPPQIVSTGIAHAIAPLADEGALARVRPDYEAIDALLAPHDAVVVYLFAWDRGAERARARSFARIVALGEDPATGSAAGPVCAYLAERVGAERVTVSQGAEMGRPSTLWTEIDSGRARVSGYVVPVIAGSVELPA